MSETTPIDRIFGALDDLTDEDCHDLDRRLLKAVLWKLVPAIEAEIDRAADRATESIEHDRAWSSAAGATHEAKAAEALVLGRAGQLFAAGKDDLASEVRSIARKLQERAKAASNNLQTFIDRDQEQRKKKTPR